MGSDPPSNVRLLAANLAFVVAAIHVGLGVVNWLRWASAGFLLPRDLRWPLFVVSGLALLAGIALASLGRYTRGLYVGGIALSVGYVVGYFGWHATGHRTLLVVGPGTPHTGPLVPFLLEHLLAGPVEFVAVVSEIALAALLFYLLVADR